MEFTKITKTEVIGCKVEFSKYDINRLREIINNSLSVEQLNEQNLWDSAVLSQWARTLLENLEGGTNGK